jgi:NADH:ubiquinone oxidoreductase subunit 3 (subunit A)
MSRGSSAPARRQIKAPEKANEESALRVPAFLYVIFSVMAAVATPVAVVFRAHELAALVALFFFFAVPLVGYVYLWRFGYLGGP